MPKARSKVAREVDALLAGHGPEGKITIVAAWTVSSSEIAPGQTWRHDLGERPKFVDVTIPHAAMWLNKGTHADVEAARRYIQREYPTTGRVFIYPVTEKDPLGRARRDILLGH